MPIRLGIIGSNGSGKSAICEILTDSGFSVFSLSDIIRELTRKKNLPLIRENLIETGNQIKQEKGMDILAKMAIEKFPISSNLNIVFDSIRNPKEVIYLKKHGVVMIGITAPLKLRYERIKKRLNDTDNVNFETFKEQDEREQFGRSSGQHINEAFKLCDFVIDNSESITELKEKLTTLLNTISIQTR